MRVNSRKGPHSPAKIMQEAAQTEEENSLRIILVVTAVKKKCMTPAKNYLFEKKRFSSQNKT